jgi:hypothetical protein
MDGTKNMKFANAQQAKENISVEENKEKIVQN